MAKSIQQVLASELGGNPLLSSHLRAISVLGYQTVEQFAGAARASRSAFENYLSTSVNELLGVLEPELPSDEELAAIANIEYGLGAEISGIPAAPMIAPEVFPSEPELPDSHDMTLRMPPIRNQNPRGTCIAHAAVAVFEHRLGKVGQEFDLSEQLLTFLCKENDNLPHLEGSLLAIAFSRLLIDGCCREETWRYNNHSNPCNWGQGPPPEGALQEAGNFRIPGIAQLPAKDVNSLKTILASENCVAFSIPAFRSWFCNDEVKLSGNIFMPPPGDLSVGGHALCMVGYRDRPDMHSLGGGEFLVRNSWGESWGENGYGTISYKFINSFCVEAYAITG